MKLHALALCLSLSAVLSANTDRTDHNQHVLGSNSDSSIFEEDAFACDLPPPVAPPAHDGLPSAKDLFSGPDALALQVHRLAAAVRVPSVSYDDMKDVDEDPRWEVFGELHRVFGELFPHVHRRMELTKVNTYGLVFALNGTDAGLKPLMLTGHQDVVPVPDPSAWTYPPYEGHYNGTWLWGRGAIDDKNSVVALLSALEALLANGDDAWTPRRGLVLAFGFDEESLGERGAGAINAYLEATYGRDSMVLLLDEGGSGLDRVGDVLYALPAVAEKGQVNIYYELRVRGGHSSMPLPHTGIGIAAELIAALEAHPFAPKLVAGSPLHHNYVCRARYSPDADPRVTKLVKHNELAALASLLSSYDPQLQFRLQTSQAVDIVQAGLKINAMPEKVQIGVNYRVAPHETLEAVKQRAVDLATPIAQKYGIAIEAFGKTVDLAAPRRGRDGDDGDDVHAAYNVDYNASLILTSPMELAVAPVTPTTGGVWDLFSGTIQDTFAFEGGRVVPVGDIMNGNTDTRSYLGLTRNVFRFEPLRPAWIQNMHAIDEALHMEGHMEAVRFYYNLIRNFDASDV
ncbi:hypothetical protein SCUCBS95973_002939 [Sporothrix curviconia]|uniref:Peptidase M20 dimerisation domain-containing protein n=1 Tax=Sporothrix curviconia TaxID=1260050 RepID=A0ABP0BBH9_9PEZI